MKPTSVIFIIFAAILIVVGVVLCIVGGSMAHNSSDTQLLSESCDADGNDITTYDLAEYNLKKYSIKLEGVDVNIIGQSVSTYIEFKNVNRATYDFTINKEKLSLSRINPFDVTSIVKIRENESGFAGLRHYLYLNKYNKSASEVNIYISPDQSIEDFDITVIDGNISVKDMVVDSNYTFNCEKGNVTFEKNSTGGNVTFTGVDSSFKYNMSNAKKVDFNIENGSSEFVIEEQYNFSVGCESGNVYIDNEKIGDSYVGIYPENTESSDEELTEVPVLVSGKVTSGDFMIVTE